MTTTMTRSDIEAKVLATLSAQVPSGGPFSGDTRILADTSFDSVSVMDFVLELEDEFDVTVPLNRMADIVTVDDLVNTIEGLLGEG